MPEARKIVLCTGANKGLGLAIIKVAALRDPAAVYILACRDTDAGHQAKQQLVDDGIKAEVEVLQLDVTNDEQISAAAEWVKNKYGKLDGTFYPSTIAA